MSNDATITGFHHTSVFVDDVQKTVQFYTEGLGLTVHYDFPAIHVAEGPLAGKELAPNGALVETGDGNYIELFPRPHGAGSESAQVFPLNHLALRADDIAAAYRRALEHGATPYEFTLADDDVWDGSPLQVEFQGEPKRQARIAFVLGPDKELIEFFENE